MLLRRQCLDQASKLLPRENRVNYNVKEARHFQLTPEGLHLNQDVGLELPIAGSQLSRLCTSILRSS